MKIQTSSKSIFCCLMACLAGSFFLATSNHTEAQVIYTITGFANNGGPVDGSPVGVDEPYTAVFEIDDSVVDSDDSAEFGRYSGAILSSSITFASGFTSAVDFAGGDITIRSDQGGGGVFFFTPDDAGAFLVYTLIPFGSDDLLITPQEISELPGSLFSLNDPDGLIITAVAAPDSAPPGVANLSVSLPSVVLGDTNLDGEVNFLDISPFIQVLSTKGFLNEADINQSGNVDFLDVPAFINILVTGNPAGY